MVSPIDTALAARLYRRARADKWGLSPAELIAAVEASVAHAFGERHPSQRDLEAFVETLRLDDLALAAACALGNEEAWDHFIREQRPVLYRAADAIDPSGGARELADSLYADLYGLDERGGRRRSLFRYFHGRSSLATWLRAVLAQRHIDAVRARKRIEPLSDAERPEPSVDPTPADPDRERLVECVRQAIRTAIAQLHPRDRLRLGCYYAQQLTLAEVGRVLNEHEATVSRRLSRTRNELRKTVEQLLRTDFRLGDAPIADALEYAVQDAGPIDLEEILSSGERKNPTPVRSKGSHRE